MTTEQRIDDLERQLKDTRRFSRRILIGLGITVVLCVAQGVFVPSDGRDAAYAQQPTLGKKIIRANHFILEDENGRGRAALFLVENEPVLCLSDENGQVRAVFEISGLTLKDKEGNQRAVLVADDRVSMLDLTREKTNAGLLAADDESILSLGTGKANAGMGATKAGAAVGLHDETGVQRVDLSARGELSGLRLYDENRKPSAMLSGDKGTTGLSLFEGTDKPRALLGLTEGGPMLGLMDPSGALRAVLTGAKDGPGLMLSDERGMDRVAVFAKTDMAGMQLKDTNDTGQAQFAVVEGKTSMLTLQSGKANAALTATPYGARLGIKDEMGMDRVTLSGYGNGVELKLKDGQDAVIWKAP